MTRPARGVSQIEAKLLHCLLLFFREIGPGATPAVAGLDEEAGLERHELEDAIKGLREKGLIEYWPLQPAVRLNAEGLRVAMSLEGERKG